MTDELIVPVYFTVSEARDVRDILDSAGDDRLPGLIDAAIVAAQRGQGTTEEGKG